MCLRLVCCGYDSQRCVHFGSRWLCEMVPSCANTRWDVIENVETFWRKCYHSKATKKKLTVSVNEHGHDRVTYCSHCVDFMEMMKISQSSRRMHRNAGDLFICCESGAEERWQGLGYFQTWIFEYEFKIYCSYDVWHTSQALRKWNMKAPKAQSWIYLTSINLF